MLKGIIIQCSSSKYILAKTSWINGSFNIIIVC